MKTLLLRTMTLAAGFAFTSAASAEGLSKAQYRSKADAIGAQYKVLKASCTPLAGNAKTVCIAEAKAKESIAKAELEEAYKPSIKNSHEVRVAKADADYAVSVARCNEKGGNEKDVCVKEAKAAKVRALADAKAWMESAKANTEAQETSAEAGAKAAAAGAEARQDAAAEKRAADYAVAKQKCEVLAGPAKDTCLSEAKVHFEQP